MGAQNSYHFASLHRNIQVRLTARLSKSHIMAGKNPVGDAIPKQDQQKRESWGEWGGRHYTQQKESWMPWIGDKYLAWFTKDNKASYATKDPLGKTKVTRSLFLSALAGG